MIKWLKRNPCKECIYYRPKDNICQSKKCASCGCHPYVSWIDRLFLRTTQTNQKKKVEE